MKVQKFFGERMGKDIVFLSITIDSEKDDRADRLSTIPSMTGPVGIT